MKSILAEIRHETQDISSFRYSPEKGFEYEAGQWTFVSLPSGQKHHFTISSSPSEDYYQFTTKNTGSAYKTELFGLSVGATLEVNGPYGGFKFDPNDMRPRLWIAGGIGITPLRPMAKYIQDKKLKINYQLIYAVKNKAEAAFVEELGADARVIWHTSEDLGRLTGEQIAKYCPEYLQREWWVSGPPAFVDGMAQQATQMGVDQAMLKTEELTGY